jgi:lipopolysaccharide/colanic/teichoic acid biosynthesis glycosyltransferase/glycosyltransferase involved in cell wall biosynthesis
MPHISVVIPAKNAAATLLVCLEALKNQDGFKIWDDYEVIVVDDGSTDSTADIAKKMGAIVISQPNGGPAAARNAGAKMASGELLLFTDADCIPDCNWIAELVRPFDDPKVIGAKGVYRTNENGWIARFVQAEYAYKYEKMKRQAAIDFIDTYSAAYRRDVFLENGGFDESFPVPSVEDQEFSFRLAGKGYKLVFQPGAAVFHAHDRNMGEYIRRKYGIGYWKAYLLHWLPEKTFNDSHTPPSQRWQIVLLGLALISGLIIPLWQASVWLTLAALLLIVFSSFLFLRFAYNYDRKISLILLPMVFVRAATLGVGLTAGFLFPRSSIGHAREGYKLMERVIKRGMDISGAIVGLLLSLPVVLLAGIAIKLDSYGPVFFLQERAGENGKPFNMVKLRTMVAGAEQLVQSVLRYNTLNGPVFKIPNDPRVTRVGRYLRRWSLDEFPQFWNVLKGEMSLVGPRPEEIWVVAQYNDAQRQRLLVKPGLTGPMQVNGRGCLDMDQRLQIEIDYINNYSLKKDISILLQTFQAIFSGRGAY